MSSRQILAQMRATTAKCPVRHRELREDKIYYAISYGCKSQGLVAAKRGRRKLSLICRKLCALGMPVVGRSQDSANPKICGFQRAFGISGCCLPLVSSNGIDSRMDCALRGHSEKRCGETAGPCDPAAVGEGMSGRNELWRRRITADVLCKPPASSVTSCGIHMHARCQTEKQRSSQESKFSRAEIFTNSCLYSASISPFFRPVCRYISAVSLNKPPVFGQLPEWRQSADSDSRISGCFTIS